MIRKTFLVAFLALALPSFASAQDPRDLSIRTFKLKNMRPEDAAKLLVPYVNSPGGGVFEAGSVGSITVRETSSILTLVDSLLRVHDKARAVISMRFKLIAALDSSMRDPAIEGIDAELRKLFRFPGYQLIGEGTMLTEEMNSFTTTLATKAMRIGSGNERFSEAFQIRGWLEGLAESGADRSLRMTVSLMSNKDELLRTGMTVPVGQTVILGSAKPTMTLGVRAALILVVQPEIAR